MCPACDVVLLFAVPPRLPGAADCSHHIHVCHCHRAHSTGWASCCGMSPGAADQFALLSAVVAAAVAAAAAALRMVVAAACKQWHNLQHVVACARHKVHHQPRKAAVNARSLRSALPTLGQYPMHPSSARASRQPTSQLSLPAPSPYSLLACCKVLPV
jgi:hypothetical protein